MFLFLLLALTNTTANAGAACDIDSLRKSFFQSYEIGNTAQVLRGFKANIHASDQEYFQSLSEKFRALGDSEADLNQKFILQKLARIRLRDIAEKNSFPIRNPLESPYDVLYREDFTNEKILARAHEIRFILAEPRVAPEAVLWQFIMQKKTNPFLVNRIVVRTNPEQVFVNFFRDSTASKWATLDTFLTEVLPEFCH